MAGERCTRKFWQEVNNPSGKTGIVCREGGKQRARRGWGSAQQMEVNRDWVEVTNNGNLVKRYVWRTAIASYNRETDTLTLRDGGYQTQLTKGRLNQVLKKINLSIRQKDFNWYINGKQWRSPMSTKLSDHR